MFRHGRSEIPARRLLMRTMVMFAGTISSLEALPCHHPPPLCAPRETLCQVRQAPMAARCCLLLGGAAWVPVESTRVKDGVVALSAFAARLGVVRCSVSGPCRGNESLGCNVLHHRRLLDDLFLGSIWFLMSTCRFLGALGGGCIDPVWLDVMVVLPR